ncbi:MAG: 2-C-methyl-D-erythritol 4-phosphate cytidylyltransferase [Lachnospiraceae bacterium]
MAEEKGQVFALVLAGGMGSRMGGDKPKQFLMAGGKPVIIHTLNRFLKHGGFKKIIVLCPYEWVSYTEEIIKEHTGNSMENIAVTAGGQSRNNTIMAGISYIEDNYGICNSTIVVTHDAARPFINNRIIDGNINTALKYGAATTAVPATDTILYCPDKKTVGSITDRSLLYMCQTPQTFYAEKFRKLYNRLSAGKKEQLTDATSVFTINNFPVGIVQGEMYNFKITYPNDLAVAEEYIKRGIV